jgi:protein SCO1/2/putative membrane protein
MGWLQIFPHLNASLNATSAFFLLLGFFFIRRKMIMAHRASMLTAFSFSGLFLICYLVHHSLRTYYFGLGPTRFTGEGIARPIYFAILTTHTILAAVIAPFVLLTLYRALKGKFELHRKIAKIVFPLWLYVSVTGVIVYLMLYQIYSVR